MSNSKPKPRVLCFGAVYVSKSEGSLMGMLGFGYGAQEIPGDEWKQDDTGTKKHVVFRIIDQTERLRLEIRRKDSMGDPYWGSADGRLSSDQQLEVYANAMRLLERNAKKQTAPRGKGIEHGQDEH